MEMNVNAVKIKKLREAKMFSQEELAIACGIGLRTIQRVEATGSASRDTVKSLASVLECDSSELLDDGRGFSPYINVQLGYTILGVCFGLAAYLSWLLANSELPIRVYTFGISILALVLLLFCTLTVRVDEKTIKWHFGLGLIRKTLDLNEVTHSRVVRNKLWWGIGIRRYETGWLYCVSGLNAVELGLEKGGTVRIGTDEPDRLNDVITRALEHTSGA